MMTSEPHQEQRIKDSSLVSVGMNMPVTGTAPQGTAHAGRLHSIDTAKGIGILLVVFGHAWHGAFAAGLLGDAAVFRAVDNMIYSWHMPLFFFLAGLVFLDAITRVTPQEFVLSRMWRLLWPMVLWTWIFFGVRLMAGQSANFPVEISDFPLIPLPPYEHLWFLWALLLVQLASLALCRALLPLITVPTLHFALGAIAFVYALCLPIISVTSLYTGPAVENAPYFIAGVAAGGLAALRPARWMAVAAAVIFAVLLIQAIEIWGPGLHSLALVVFFWVMIAHLDTNADEPGVILKVLRYLGVMSLIIFLAHTIFTAAFRIGFVSVGVTDLWVHLSIGTLVGVVGPIVLYHGLRRLGVTKWFGV